MKRPITLNDGTYIYSEYTLAEYLTSLGFDMEDLVFEEQYEKAYDEGYRDALQRTEREVDGYYCALRDLGSEIQNICADFRKKYKAPAVVKVLDTIEKYIYENSTI